MADPLELRVVSADRVVWSGQAENVIAKTVEGDIGILAGHEPVLALLAPGGVEVIQPDGNREIVAVDGGFISVARRRVSIISEYARMAEEITVDRAERALADARQRLDAGEDDEETRKAYRRAEAQLSAANKAR
ncbi:ATP synthase epsilon chain [Microlunatus endophyticus]|uniref:ATP synthase epsilon chain n=1 Tax=Microlunatus endophyticus TaxID=1716077 RepID=A0A917W1A5_9ACTN|nr:F0F1 ATP synthase subunit epsilon [Microlunatus endophyticus]GGL55429.1 ATP synthase epsilon chain [Microlunatus endophyticus]